MTATKKTSKVHEEIEMHFRMSITKVVQEVLVSDIVNDMILGVNFLGWNYSNGNRKVDNEISTSCGRICTKKEELEASSHVIIATNGIKNCH